MLSLFTGQRSPSTSANAQQADGPAVTAQQLEVAYDGRSALCCADLAIPREAITVLIGPNGSGKSTLMSAIAGLVTPRSGELQVLGSPGPARPGRAAYVMQSTEVDSLLPISVVEVVTMARFARRGFVSRLDQSDRQAVTAAMDRMEIGDLANRRINQLSGGQRQRALVAQGLAQEAEILMLDEPVMGLDLVSRQRIDAAVAAERSTGRCVIISSHDLDDARTADHVVLLAGRVVAEGPAEAVLVPNNLRATYGHRYLEAEDDTDVGIVDDRHGHGHPDSGGSST